MGAVKISCVSFQFDTGILPVRRGRFYQPMERLPLRLFTQGARAALNSFSNPNLECCINMMRAAKLDLQPADITTNYRTNRKSLYPS